MLWNTQYLLADRAEWGCNGVPSEIQLARHLGKIVDPTLIFPTVHRISVRKPSPVRLTVLAAVVFGMIETARVPFRV
jgi:hypothetical protein